MINIKMMKQENEKYCYCQAPKCSPKGNYLNKTNFGFVAKAI